MLWSLHAKKVELFPHTNFESLFRLLRFVIFSRYYMLPKQIEVIEIDSSSGDDVARETGDSDIEVVRPAPRARGTAVAASGDLERDGLSIAGGTLVRALSLAPRSLALSPSFHQN